MVARIITNRSAIGLSLPSECERGTRQIHGVTLRHEVGAVAPRASAPIRLFSPPGLRLGKHTLPNRRRSLLCVGGDWSGPGSLTLWHATRQPGTDEREEGKKRSLLSFSSSFRLQGKQWQTSTFCSAHNTPALRGPTLRHGQRYTFGLIHLQVLAIEPYRDRGLSRTIQEDAPLVVLPAGPIGQNHDLDSDGEVFGHV